MNQYERIVSYIYQYENGEKGVNAGYARIEKRGNQCRFSVQIRAVAMAEIPKIYFYRQFPEGIQTIYAGSMVFRGNNMIWKASSEAERLFQSDWNLEEADGIFIDGAEKKYFATSWKQDHFYLGNWDKNSTVVKTTESKKEEGGQSVEQAKKSGQKSVTVEDTLLQDLEVTPVQKTVQELVAAGEETEPEKKSNGQMEVEKEALQSDIQMQSVCGVCPLKRKDYDYGKKLLMTFPAMKPFQEGVAQACVRMELQDLGCLPITFWSLSGNRFLLHGYYCYRHLLFAQLLDGKYILGVPGIFSEKEKQNALRFGFSDFQSIGELGKQHGVFGYWVMELPKENI